jgi:hypothetical protein
MKLLSENYWRCKSPDFALSRKLTGYRFSAKPHHMGPEVRDILSTALYSTGKTLPLDTLPLKPDEALPLENLFHMLKDAAFQNSTEEVLTQRLITFPYSRHSSYYELCDLVDAFKPADVYPCTVNDSDWHEGKSLEVFSSIYVSQ